MVLKIRRASVKDTSVIVELNTGLVESQYKNFLKSSVNAFFKEYNLPGNGLMKEKLAYIRKMLHDYYTIIAFDKNVPVGFLTVAFYKEPFYKYSSYADIIKLYVIDSYRGKGVSSLLFSKAVEDFKKKSNYLMISVNACNHRALRVYENWGFVKHGYAMMLDFASFKN